MSDWDILKNPTSNPVERRERLDDILQHLKSSDIRHLKQRLADTKLEMDFVIQLPVEIILLIAQYLLPLDVYRSSYVSKKWRETWQLVQVLDFMMKQYFRQEFETKYRLLGALDKFQFFRIKLKLQRLRQQVLYSRYECFDTPKPVAGINFCKAYCNGRVAFRDQNGVIVHTIATAERRSFQAPSREQYFRDMVLSDSHVAVISMPNKVHAWSLRDGQYHEARFPHRPSSPILQADRLAMFTRAGLFIWKIGSAVSEFNLQPLMNSSSDMKPETVIFHPTSQEMCVIWTNSKSLEKMIHSEGGHSLQESRTQDPQDLPKLRLASQCYLDDLLVAENELHVTFDRDLTAFAAPEISPSFFRPQRVDMNGTFIFATFRGHLQVSPNFGTEFEAQERFSHGDYHTIFLYNAYERRIALKWFDTGAVAIDRHIIPKTHVWGDRMFVPTQFSPLTSFPSRGGRDFPGVDFGQTSIALTISSFPECEDPGKESSTLLEKFCRRDPSSHLFEVPLGEISLTSVFAPDMELKGDENIVVLLAETGYVCWVFDV